MHTNNWRKRTTSAIFIAIVVVAMVAQSAAAYIQFSDPGTSPNEKAQAHQYATFIYKCLATQKQITPDIGAVKDYHIFASRTALEFGYYSKITEDGTAQCQDDTILRPALSYFGWATAQQFLCEMGATRFDGSSCAGESDAKYSLSDADEKFRSLLRQRVGGEVIDIPGEVAYVYDLKTFSVGCEVTSSRIYDATTDANNSANDHFAKIRYVTADGKINADYLYEFNAAKADVKAVRATAGPIRCDALISTINANANAYVTWTKSHPPGSNGNPGTCNERFPNSEVLQKACQDGFDHKTDSLYCMNTYQTGSTDSQLEAQRPAFEACGYGAKTATARDGSTTSTDPSGTPDKDGGTSTCAVDGIGWLVCPVMTFLSKTMDGVLEFVAKNFLEVKSELLNTKSGTYQAWDAFRGYANVAFVIAFLVIIYSQITNVGVSNYGIKRMIPKLIISAILVNLSYFICQIAVDVSNLAGYGVKDVFDAAIKTVTAGRPSGGGMPSWLDTIGPILAVGAGVLLALSLGVLGAAIVAAAMIVIILVARKAFIVILVVLAPLAFVAYLLPNTEQWFKKWWKAFSTILLVFPIISLLFGGGKLAASVLNTAGASVDASKVESTALQLTALGVMVIPIFAVLPVLKGAMSAAGTIGAKLKGMGDKATGRVSSKAKEGRENSYINRIKQLRSKDRSVRQAMVAGGSYKGRNPVQRARSAIFARANRSRITGNSGDRMAAQGASLADKEFDENVNAAKATFSGKTFEEIKDISHDTGADSATRTAAIQHIMEKGNFSQRNELVKLTTGMNSAQRSSVVNGLMSRGDQAIYGADIGDAITKGQIGSTPADADAKINNFIANNIASKKVKAETMVHDAEATKLIADVVTGGGTYTLKDPSTGALVSRTLSAAEIGAVRTAATEATRLPATASKASQNFKDEFARL